MKILMTGATGLIGKELGKALVSRGHEILAVSRQAAKARLQLPFPCQIIEADLSAGPLKEREVLNSTEVVINLAGDPIGEGRWTEARKRRIYESRILGTRHLIQSLPMAPKIFLNASAIGYYGSQGDEEISEQSPAGDDFLSQVCQDWEEELLDLSYGKMLASTRRVVLRTGMVLSEKGGALDKILPLFHRGLGGVLGEGKQWMSWIHIEDEVGLILHILEKNSLQGPINLVSPQPVTNEQFTHALATVLGVKAAPRVPAIVLWSALGEMASLVLNSQKVLPVLAQESGYNFLYPELHKALEQICASEKKNLLVKEQFLPWKPAEIFNFFAQAGNLQLLTSPSAESEILSSPAKIELGVELIYRLKIQGFPVKWKSRITEWSPPYRFTDRQVEGPFHHWEHSHELRPFTNGTLMVDRVNYSLPMGALGNLMGGWLARSEIENSFLLRRKALIKNIENDLGLSPRAPSRKEGGREGSEAEV
ncbi:MAG: TIGR01777 family oxidoreductase [Pseudobdellovibrionaceae bacterium]